ncbi:hypothetical protein GGX14DRAFT_596744 [Mycena pura]|uniref:Uncharacterized protein n=1 Tax=Mycena pura TaxID=153505 RepID=A0AAD6Y165_9AGAR|nr:hypothetical protein GGX14DRAFT_596744 [Mycena pura]
MSEAEFPLTEAQIMGNWFETLTYGMYFVTCGFCARALLFIGPEGRWRKPNEVNWFMLSVAILLFVVGTFDVVVGFAASASALVSPKILMFGQIGLLHNLRAFAFFMLADSGLAARARHSARCATARHNTRYLYARTLLPCNSSPQTSYCSVREA